MPENFRKIQKSRVILVIILILLSVSIYYLQYRIFHQRANTMFYLFQDLAFVPIQVLLVTLLLNRFLNMIEAQKKRKKINVIISVFFVEAGTEILTAMSLFHRNREQLSKLLRYTESEKSKSMSRLKKEELFRYEIDLEQDDLADLSSLLNKYREFMLHMLGNDNLLEHDSFTDMLWAVFHVADELKMRLGEQNLQPEDMNHLAIDIRRAYTALLYEWMNYMRYLKTEYPFLYVTATKKARSVLVNEPEI